MDSLLESALDNLSGDAVAIGAGAEGQLQFVGRGFLGDEPVGSRTRFYGASVTKQVVGIAAARAVVQGVVDIDASIVSWIPELPEWMESVTLGDLIHHTSDLPDVADPALGVPRSNHDIVKRFRSLQAQRPEPGVRFGYNNAGYVLLAEAVSRSLGRPIVQVAGELFATVGLSGTTLGGRAVRLEGWPDPPGTVGDGGLWTCGEDLTRWLAACNAAAFGAEVHRLAESTTLLSDGSALDYAWGIRVTPIEGGRMITHGGSWEPWLAKTVRIPEHRVAVAVLSVGSTEGDVSRTGTDLALALVRAGSGR